MGGTAKAASASLMGALIEGFQINQADRGLGMIVAGNVLRGSVMVGLAIIGNIPGGNVAANLARTVKAAQGCRAL